MRALVVFESIYGNTQKVAEAVAEGLSSYGHVDLIEVGSAPSTVDSDVDLLVVGGPTHAHGMSRQSTRESGAKDAPAGAISRNRGLREWLVSLGEASPERAAATFDTRFDKPRWLTGSAAHTAANRLRQHHYRLDAAPRSFYIEGASGPLRDGELERARQWGAMLGSQIAARASK